MRHTTYIWMGAALLALVMAFGCGDMPGEREFAQALRRMDRGEWVRAKDLLEQSILKRPGHEENARAYAFLGWVEWKLDNEEAALEAFESSLRMDPRRWELLYNIGVLMHDRGEAERAIQVLRRAYELAPEETRPLEYIAWIHMDAGDRREARSAFYEALSVHPHSPRILTALALLEWERVGSSAALPYLMRAFEAVPDYPPALYNLAVLYERQPHRQEEARTFYRQYLDLGPGLPRTGDAERALARMRGELEPPAEDVVTDPVPEAEPIEPEPEPEPVTPADTWEAMIDRARRLAAEGETGLAAGVCIRAATEARLHGLPELEERALRMAVEWAPDSDHAHYAMGRFYTVRGRHGEALEAYRRAVDLRGDWVPVLLALGDAAARLGEYDEARVALSRASDAQPDNPDPLWALARFYDEILDLTHRALNAYQAFEDRFPEDPRAGQARERIRRLRPAVEEPLETRPARPPDPVESPPEIARDVGSAVQAFNRGVTHQRRGDWDSAVRFYERAVTLDPAFVQAWYNLGLAHRTMGRRDEARRALERAVILQPDMRNARHNLALLYWDMQNREAAVREARAVLRVDPDYALAHYLLGHIYAQDPETLSEARRHYRRFLALVPDDPAAPAIRQWLED